MRRSPVALVAAAAVLSLVLATVATAADPPEDGPGKPTPASELQKQPEPIPNEPWRPNDKRRTLRSYGSNLFHNGVAVVSRENAGSLIVTAALVAPAYAFDDRVVDYFARNPHPDFGRIGARLGGGLAIAGLTIGLFSAGRYSHNDRFRAGTYDVSQAVILTHPGLRAGRLHRELAAGREQAPPERRRRGSRAGVRSREGGRSSQWKAAGRSTAAGPPALARRRPFG